MKFSRIITLMLAVAMVALFCGAGLAQDHPTKSEHPTKAKAAAEKVDVSKMSGKELYKSRCKVCHGPDADAGEYTPMSLIMEQWEEFFDGQFAETHKDVVCPKDKSKKVPQMFDKDMLKKIKKFCVDHAADSEQPMTCG